MLASCSMDVLHCISLPVAFSCGLSSLLYCCQWPHLHILLYLLSFKKLTFNLANFIYNLLLLLIFASCGFVKLIENKQNNKTIPHTQKQKQTNKTNKQTKTMTLKLTLMKLLSYLLDLQTVPDRLMQMSVPNLYVKYPKKVN